MSLSQLQQVLESIKWRDFLTYSEGFEWENCQIHQSIRNVYILSLANGDNLNKIYNFDSQSLFEYLD